MLKSKIFIYYLLCLFLFSCKSKKITEIIVQKQAVTIDSVFGAQTITDSLFTLEINDTIQFLNIKFNLKDSSFFVFQEMKERKKIILVPAENKNTTIKEIKEQNKIILSGEKTKRFKYLNRAILYILFTIVILFLFSLKINFSIFKKK